MQELSINKNNVGGYKYNAAVTLIKQINRVLEQQLFEDSADGMVGLGSKNAEHSDNLQVQRRHQEEQLHETVDRRSTSGHLDKATSLRPRSRQTPMHKTRQTDKTRQGLR